jgi:hypothetical protein
VLLTSEEADKLRISEQELMDSHMPQTRSISMGPYIYFIDPRAVAGEFGTVLETKSPTNMWIRFEENLAPVDLDTLDVKVCKSLFCKHLNDLLYPYIIGMEIKARDVKIPHGKFRVIFSIADNNGNITEEEYLLTVSN